ncbi:hypothetical protein MOV76_08220 [Rhizobium sp. PRIMUS64]|uniref:hypothetical protein n=1 Tax=Rhizobium TaxID=379 RepID=UPI001C919911|nr:MULTISPECIES: hypothetical protein [Rhizobium]MBY3260342.1 hypothetical protein [Rhizobium laguerreae]MBY3335650.1 hypothetical protein [Rhizobium laguerreae]MCJ9691621.1 hypothetical protein [Rhizobium sp. PRIMUS64]
MPNEAIAATAEGLPNTTRRALLWSLAAASTAAAVAVAPDAHGAIATEAQALPRDQAENPALILACQKFHGALAELKEAQDSLEWIADEWRHQWPLAPEDLLLGANAQDGRYTMPAERDIIGRFLVRDTSDLTKRLAPKFRRENRKTCFVIRTAAEERDVLKRWKRSTPTGRTEKALARNRAYRTKAIRECELRIQLAVQYEAETAHLRDISGADAARLRIRDADIRLRRAADEVSHCRALSLADLAMKANVLAVTAGDLMELTKPDATPLGQMARFIESVAEVIGRAAV